ncbi:MAG: helix-turn-helix transcriptional regulator [Deltaproteobacteria bacterium]|nr:helix-turn-helix transcriptional regulator [Deltaproteobacteria bacterium]
MKSDELFSRLGARVRELRERRGWSQETLAERCGKHYTYVGRIERGVQNVTIEVLAEVADALGATLADLVAIDDHPLLRNWNVSALDVVHAVHHGFRAQVDVKGKLAEWKLFQELEALRTDGAIASVQWLDEDNKPDFILTVAGRDIVVECKNVRSKTKSERPDAPIKVELQKTRNSKDGTNTRGYSTSHFHVLSVCLFNRTGRWTFLHVAVNNLATRPDDAKMLKVFHAVPASADSRWRSRIEEAIGDLAR